MAQAVTTRDEVVKLKEAGLGPAAIGRELGISRQRAWTDHPCQEKADLRPAYHRGGSEITGFSHQYREEMECQGNTEIIPYRPGWEQEIPPRGHRGFYQRG